MRTVLAALLLSSSLLPVASHALPSIPKRTAFTPIRLASLQVDTLLGSEAAQQAARIVDHYGCPTDTIWLYTRQGQATSVLTVACFNHGAPDIGATRAGYGFLEYPLVLVIKGNHVQRVENFDAHGFMYESGRILGVGDRDRDGDPEFLLEGTTSEGDGDDDPCSGSAGLALVEARGARLAPLSGVVEIPCKRR